MGVLTYDFGDSWTALMEALQSALNTNAGALFQLAAFFVGLNFVIGLLFKLIGGVFGRKDAEVGTDAK